MSSLFIYHLTFRFQCYKENMAIVQKCSCTKYKVYHTVYVNGTVPTQVTYLSGIFTKEERPEHTHGLLAPLYIDAEKQLMLFSHHPQGLVWQVSQKLTTTPLRGVFSGPSCPDSESITWEWYNVTTPQVLYRVSYWNVIIFNLHLGSTSLRARSTYSCQMCFS